MTSVYEILSYQYDRYHVLRGSVSSNLALC